ITSLAKLTRNLTSLSLNGTPINDIMPLARMTRLERLDLRNCKKLPADDTAWLTKRLADCKIQADRANPKPQKPANPNGW
ncbi:MAG: leucine-rich repeat domain-containing protein, partial [Pirellulales bacterium]|nr:leucine-rich repeat domain-containing protein [Pirellulales bacterium]